MKLTPFRLTSFRRTFGRSFCAIASIGFLTASAQAQLVTSFESSDGFVVGATPNPANASTSWQGSNDTNSVGYQYISNAYAYDGTQSLAMKNGAPDYYFTRTRNGMTLYDMDSLSYSFRFMHQGGDSAVGPDIARFEMYYNSSSADLGARIIMELQYGADPDSYRIRFSNNNTGDQALNINLPIIGSSVFSDVALGSISDLSSWNLVTVTLDAVSNNLIVAINGENIVDAIALNTAVFNADSRVNMLRFTTPKGGTGTTYYDNVTTAIPEPSLGLLAVLGAGVLVVRRRKRAC